LIIRDITRDDYPAIAKMMKDFESYIDSLDPKTDFKRSIDMEKQLKRLDPIGHGGAGLIAEELGKSLGYLLYFRSASFAAMERTISLPDLYVAQGQRGKGVGKKLVAALTVIARQHKAKSIVWSVYDRNPKAISFYLNLGAEYVRDEMIMTLKVPKALRKPQKRAKAKSTRA
jgi:GNAT superfamily N-acetyltransferase